jgi:uncharacterized membrane protein YcaP (DUF421 family)
MESVLRGILIYYTLFLIFRISGKRALNESSPFGLILIFLISSSVSDALKGEDRSITNSLLLATTLIGLHVLMALLKSRKRKFAKFIDDVPTLLVKDGELLKERMKESKVTKEDILLEARKKKLGHISEIEYAILEIDGSICIIPKENEGK